MNRKKFLNFFVISLAIYPLLSSGGCSKDDVSETFPEDWKDYTIGFADAPAELFGSSAYGENLYNGDIKKGYIYEIDGLNYLQFPINYGYNYDANFNMSWCYTLYNGGCALSNYHDMTNATYLNQLSVYDTTSPSGGNFIVTNGSSLITDPQKAIYSDYDGCAHIYFTNREGFGVDNEKDPHGLTGESLYGYFKSVYINNTTYTYLTMRDGNDFCKALNEENKGWLKVQFLAFDSIEPEAKSVGTSEVFLANFNPDLADGYQGIIDEWIKVDLSNLPECCVLVVNFVGSDSGEWGLNTPAYCALDNFEVSTLILNEKK